VQSGGERRAECVTAHHQLTATLAQDYRFTAGPGGVPVTTHSCGTGQRIADPALTVHRSCAIRIIIPGQPSLARLVDAWRGRHTGQAIDIAASAGSPTTEPFGLVERAKE
jgi:hypothetical protein